MQSSSAFMHTRQQAVIRGCVYVFMGLCVFVSQRNGERELEKVWKNGNSQNHGEKTAK